MQSLDADDLESLKSQLIDGVTKLYERACICRQKSNECSKAREFPLQSFPDTNYKQMEKLQQRDKRLRTENEKLKHVVQVYNNRRRSDQESVKRWMAYAKELEKVNQQLMTDVKVLQRQSISGVEPANIFDNGQIGTHSSQIPTDSTCDEEGILQDEIKQEPVDKVEIKKEPNSSPDFSTPTANKVVDDRTNASSQLPAHLVPDSLDLEAPVFSRTHLNDDKLSCIAQVASSRDCHSVLHSDSDNGGGCHPGYELHTELQSDSDNGAHSHTGADGLSVTVSSMTNGLTPKSLKRPAKPNFHEIDQDLRSGKRRVMFESPNVQLPTPKTLGAQRRITDSWLNKDIINKASFSSRLNDDTPIKHKLDSQPIKNIDFKSTDKNTFISRCDFFFFIC